MNRTGLSSSTNQTSSNIPAKAKETEPIFSRKETDDHSLKRSNADDATTKESIPSESITENDPDIPTNGTARDIFTRTSPNVWMKDTGPLAPAIEKPPNLHIEERSSGTSTTNETGIDVAPKRTMLALIVQTRKKPFLTFHPRKQRQGPAQSLILRET